MNKKYAKLPMADFTEEEMLLDSIHTIKAKVPELLKMTHPPFRVDEVQVIQQVNVNQAEQK